jgi:hypothetical protein
MARQKLGNRFRNEPRWLKLTVTFMMSKREGFGMSAFRVTLLLTFVFVFGSALGARAQSVTITKAVQDACAWEYNQFCNQYGIGTELLDICFRQNADHMTKACVDALIAAGDVSQEYVDQQKKLLGR